MNVAKKLDDFILIKISDGKIRFAPQGRPMENVFIRGDFIFEYNNKTNILFTNFVLRRTSKGYLPGTLDYRMTFTQHAIRQKYISIESIDLLETTNSMVLNVSVCSTCNLNIGDNESFNVANLKLKFINRSDVQVFSKVINDVNDYLMEGLSIENLNTTFGYQFLFFNEDPKKWRNRISEFCKKLKFKEWQETTFRGVRKDSRFESGYIVYNIPNDKYLIRLMSENTKFGAYKNGRMTGYDQNDFSYSPASPYSEYDIVGNELRREILFALILNFDHHRSHIYSMRLDTESRYISDH